MAKAKSKAERAARERARVYEARQQLHEAQGRRKRRDNLLISGVGVLVLAAAIGAQTAYYALGPGSAEPTPEDPSVVEPGTVDPAPLPLDQ